MQLNDVEDSDVYLFMEHQAAIVSVCCQEFCGVPLHLSTTEPVSHNSVSSSTMVPVSTVTMLRTSVFTLLPVNYSKGKDVIESKR